MNWLMSGMGNHVVNGRGTFPLNELKVSQCLVQHQFDNGVCIQKFQGNSAFSMRYELEKL